MKIIAFGAHPDDIELHCGGTLAKYKAAGHEVAMAVSTNGEVGSSTLGKEEIAAIREKEAREAAAILGAEFFWMGYPDEFLFNSEAVRLHYIEIIRRFQPDIIITHDKDADYHPDHTTTGQIIWDTHVMVTVPNIKTESAPCSKIPEIFFMDTAGGVNFQPENYVDISSFWQTKSDMIDCHRSQESWMYDTYGVSSAEFARTVSSFRGFQAGCRYAECFRKPKFFPWAVKKDRLL